LTGSDRRECKARAATIQMPMAFELDRIKTDVVRIVERANGASKV